MEEREETKIRKDNGQIFEVEETITRIDYESGEVGFVTTFVFENRPYECDDNIAFCKCDDCENSGCGIEYTEHDVRIINE